MGNADAFAGAPVWRDCNLRGGRVWRRHFGTQRGKEHTLHCRVKCGRIYIFCAAKLVMDPFWYDFAGAVRADRKTEVCKGGSVKFGGIYGSVVLAHQGISA